MGFLWAQAVWCDLPACCAILLLSPCHLLVPYQSCYLQKQQVSDPPSFQTCSPVSPGLVTHRAGRSAGTLRTLISDWLVAQPRCSLICDWLVAQDLSLPLLLQTFVAMEGGHGPRMDRVTRNDVTAYLNPPCDSCLSLWCLSC